MIRGACRVLTATHINTHSLWVSRSPDARRLTTHCPAPLSYQLSRAVVRVRWFASPADGGKGKGAVSWLSSKLSKKFSKMGAFEAAKKAADKGYVVVSIPHA